MTDSPFKAALLYAAKGVEVFPVSPETKAPLTAHAYKDATTDEAKIRKWWTDHPTANVAIRVAPGDLVIDLDPRHGALDTLKALEDAYGPLTPTRTHLSGRGDGGGHLWWHWPADPKTASTAKLDEWAKAHNVGEDLGGGKWTAGFDLIHHDLRYSIAPPSTHPETGDEYTWVKTKNNRAADIADPPGWLVEYLTAPPKPARIPRTASQNAATASSTEFDFGDFNRRHPWPAILQPHGWTLVKDAGGGGDAEHSTWLRPGSDSKQSAEVGSLECLYVYSTSTPFETSSTSSGVGYTRFQAWALLNHGEDGKRGPTPKAFAAALTDAGIKTHAEKRADVAAWVAGLDTDPDAGDLNLPVKFWERAELAQIRAAAHSRQRSADAVLGFVLARLAARIPPSRQLPPIVGTPASLNFYTAIVAGPGAGKSSSKGIADELLPGGIDADVDGIGPGSGEGLIDAFYITTIDDDPKSKTKGKEIKRRRPSERAYLYADEGEAFLTQGERSGSTIFPYLRSVWSGGNVGQANAGKETKRHLEAHSYRVGLAMAIQPDKAGSLFTDINGGLPQRFLFLAAGDPTIPDRPTGAVERLELADNLSLNTQFGTPAFVDVDEPIADEIRAADLAAQRTKAGAGAAIDGHANLVRLKTAALLGILNGRLAVDADDWELAGLAWDTSCRVRDWMRSSILDADKAALRRQDKILAKRDAFVAEDRRTRAILSMARAMTRKVTRDGPLGRTELRNVTASRDRKEAPYEDGLAEAIARGWLVEDEINLTYSRGTSTP